MTPRVWDPFLTERDRGHLSLGYAKREPFGLGRRPALLVVDNTQQVLGDEPLPLLDVARDFTMRCGLEGWAAIETTRGVLGAARGAGALVVFTVNAGRGSATSLDRAGAHLVTDGGGVAVVVSEPGGAGEATAWGIHRAIPPQPGDLVLQKGSASAFFGTTLLSHLVAAGIDTVLVCGNSTSGCVRHTVLDSASYQFKTAVIEDCTFDRTQASHAINLFDMHQKYADVIDSADAIAYLESLGCTRSAS